MNLIFRNCKIKLQSDPIVVLTKNNIMKKTLVTLMLGLSMNSFAQFQVGHTSYNFNDPGRTTAGYTISGTPSYGTGRKVGCEVYYPATIAGDNKPFAAGTFPVVAFGHGFVMTWDSYDNIYNLLAQRGYIVVLPRTEGSFSPVHSDFGADLALAIDSIRLYGNTASKLIFGHVGSTGTIGGHSMGGGSSFLGAKNNTGIDCLFNFAAANTNPSSIAAAPFVTVPTLVMGGLADCVAPNAANQDSMYLRTASTTKFEVIFKALTHCDFGDGANFNCTFGQNSSGCANSVSNTVANGRYMYYLNNYLDYYLKNDCQAGTNFMDSISASTLIVKQIQGDISCVTAIGNKIHESFSFEVFPNPSSQLINLKFSHLEGKETIEIYNVTGELIKKLAVNNLEGSNQSKILIISDMDPGIYFIKLNNDQNEFTKKIIKI